MMLNRLGKCFEKKYKGKTCMRIEYRRKKKERRKGKQVEKGDQDVGK